MAYMKFFIQQQSYDGVNYTDVGSVIDTYTSFGVVCQEFPFKYLPESKDIVSRDWSDESGDDACFPADGMKFKAYDIEAKFLYSGAAASMYDNISSFVDFLYGRNDGGSPLLAVYDEYTQTGRRGVYVLSLSCDEYSHDDSRASGLAVIKVKFRVTDPVSDVSII